MPNLATLLAVSGSFLLGVLCMDLAFDTQALGDSPQVALALPSIAAYYGRILGDANPMGTLVVAAMIVSLLGAAYQTARPSGPRWLPATALFLGVCAIALTALQVVPAATEVVQGTQSVSVQAALARRVAIVHMGCFSAFTAYVAIEVHLSRGRQGRAA